LLRNARDQLRATEALPGLATGLAQLAEAKGERAVPVGQTLHYLFMHSLVFTGGVLVVDGEGTVLWTEPDQPRLIGQSIGAGSVVREAVRDGREAAGRALGISESPSAIAVSVPIKDFSGAVTGALIGVIDVDHSATRLAMISDREAQTRTSDLEVDGGLLSIGRAGEPRWRVAEVVAGRVIARAPVNDTRWSIVVSQDEAEIASSSRQLRRTLLAVGIAIAIVLGALTVPLMNRVLRPVESLAEAAQSLARGEFEHPLPARAPGELGGLVEAFAKMRHDIRELLRRLTASEAMYKRAIDRAADAIVAIDPENGAILSANQRALELTGCREDDLRGRPAHAFFSPEEVDGLSAHLAQVVRKGDGDELEARLMRIDGSFVPIAIRSTVIEDDRAQRFIQQIWRDLTERKALERRMVENEKMTSLGALAAGVAHEIRNPLSVVVTNLDFIQRELKDQTRRPDDLAAVDEALVDIMRASQHISMIVDDIYMFAHPTQTTTKAAFEVTDLGKVADHAIRIASVALKSRVEIRRDYGEIPAVLAEPGRLLQVVLNLVMNAADAIAETGRKGEIRVRTAATEDGQVLLEVADDGAGIAPANMRRIFDPFFTTKAPGKGSGIGLSLVYRIVQDHRGTIDVDSTVGSGTRFTVRLPRAKTDEANRQLGWS
jgi:PAS domain S-box-containing protein